MAEGAPYLRFFGVAAYELVTGQGKHILIDPFLDENPANPVKSADLEQVDLIVVSHAAHTHLGDTEAIARRSGAPIICGGEVAAYLHARGIPQEQIRSTVWGLLVDVAGIRVQPVECHHWSQLTMPDGTLVSGVPMGFVVYVEPGIRFYHYGDTAIFSDLRLIGELYQPTVGCVGIANPTELDADEIAAGKMLTGEMNPYEGALASQWLGLKTVLPCHYNDPSCVEVQEFNQHLEEARARGEQVPESVVLGPGDTLALEPVTDA